MQRSAQEKAFVILLWKCAAPAQVHACDCRLQIVWSGRKFASICTGSSGLRPVRRM